MKKSLVVMSSAFVLAMAAPLAQPIVWAEGQEEVAQVESSIQIEGLADHYHTGDEVKLTASAKEKGAWQWYIRSDEEADWRAVEGLTTPIFSREATHDGLEVKAVLLKENGEVITESQPVHIHIDDHHGHGDENAERIYSGFFYNDEVADRELSDWQGDWQSVYPYLKSGDLDPVFEAKAAKNDKMSAEAYKEYYQTGYETDVEKIMIDGQKVSFTKNGKEMTATYEYQGHDVLTYERGNRGVRFSFKKVDGAEKMPAWIQFSDHNIHPNKAAHFHLYWGDDRQELLKEMDHWPTYYPAAMDAEALVHDMLHH